MYQLYRRKWAFAGVVFFVLLSLYGFSIYNEKEFERRLKDSMREFEENYHRRLALEQITTVQPKTEPSTPGTTTTTTTATTTTTTTTELTTTTTTLATTTPRQQWRPNLAELPPDDASTLVNLTNFAYLLDAKPCAEGRAPTLLVAVHSAPDHEPLRRAIRRTWGSPRDDVKVVYLLGAVNAKDKQDTIAREHAEFGDIVQGNFVDAYRNMSCKHVMALKWALYNCAGAAFVLKVDDDNFVNVPRLLRYVRGFVDTPVADNSIICGIYDGNPALRVPSKWFVSVEEYPDPYYPRHCSGFAIVYPMRVAFKIYKGAQRVNYFWIDDAYVSGIVAKRVNVTHHNLENKHVTYERLDELLHNGTYAPTPNATKFEEGFLFGPVNVNAKIIERMWNWTLRAHEVK